MAEALAIRNDFYLASHLGCDKIIVESICLQMIEALQSAKAFLGPLVAVIAECHQLLKHFGRMTVKHCNREANQVADCLAKSSFEKGSSVWDDPSDFISSMIVNDAPYLMNKVFSL